MSKNLNFFEQIDDFDFEQNKGQNLSQDSFGINVLTPVSPLTKPKTKKTKKSKIALLDPIEDAQIKSFNPYKITELENPYESEVEDNDESDEADEKEIKKSTPKNDFFDSTFFADDEDDDENYALAVQELLAPPKPKEPENFLNPELMKASQDLMNQMDSLGITLENYLTEITDEINKKDEFIIHKKEKIVIEAPKVAEEKASDTAVEAAKEISADEQKTEPAETKLAVAENVTDQLSNATETPVVETQSTSEMVETAKTETEQQLEITDVKTTVSESTPDVLVSNIAETPVVAEATTDAVEQAKVADVIEETKIETQTTEATTTQASESVPNTDSVVESAALESSTTPIEQTNETDSTVASEVVAADLVVDQPPVDLKENEVTTKSDVSQENLVHKVELEANKMEINSAEQTVDQSIENELDAKAETTEAMAAEVTELAKEDEETEPEISAPTIDYSIYTRSDAIPAVSNEELEHEHEDFDEDLDHEMTDDSANFADPVETEIEPEMVDEAEEDYELEDHYVHPFEQEFVEAESAKAFEQVEQQNKPEFTRPSPQPGYAGATRNIHHMADIHHPEAVAWEKLETKAEATSPSTELTAAVKPIAKPKKKHKFLRFVFCIIILAAIAFFIFWLLEFLGTTDLVKWPGFDKS